MAPEPVTNLRRYVDKVQTSFSDPAERTRALTVVKRDLEDTLGMVDTYIGDARLEQEGSAGSSNGDTPTGTAPSEGPTAT